MISERTTKLFNSLAELFGMPSWRQGQDKEKIMNAWEQEVFQYYDDAVLEQAFYELFRYGKCNTFPKMAQVKAMLMNKETKDFTKANNLETKTEVTDNFLDWSHNVIKNNWGITSCDTDIALHRAVERIDLEYPPQANENTYRSVGDLAKLGILNGVFWQYLNIEMEKIIKYKLGENK